MYAPFENTTYARCSCLQTWEATLQSSSNGYRLTRMYRWIDQQILWFDVTVYYVVVMTPGNCFD